MKLLLRKLTIACLLLSITAATNVAMADYSPADVAIINGLIAGNGLQATPDEPDSWDFAGWNNESPQRITDLDFDGRGLSGSVSLTGLTALESLFCTGNSLSGLNVSGCTNLESLYGSNNELTDLNVSGCENLTSLACSGNSLDKLNVSDCTRLESLSCDNNKLSALDLNGLFDLADFAGDGQKVTILFEGNETDGYSLEIYFYNPVFTAETITYDDALQILSGTDKSVTESNFTIETGWAEMKLEGTMFFTYPGETGNDEYAATDVAVINALIANNGLQATPDAPETWDFAEWSNDTPRQILRLDFYESNHSEMAGEASFTYLTELVYLNCFQNNLSALDVSECSNLIYLDCSANNMNELKINDCIALETLYCENNSLSELDLTGCTNLTTLYCYSNQLTALDLSAINSLGEFNGHSQEVTLPVFTGNKTDGYSLDIQLNAPAFDDPTLGYNGTLTATGSSAFSTAFSVETGWGDANLLEGTMKLNYPDRSCPVLESFSIKWTEANINHEEKSIRIDHLNTDQKDCMEVYFSINTLFNPEDYEIYLQGENGVNEQLGLDEDLGGVASTYVCFTDITNWSGTLYIVQKDGASLVKGIQKSIGEPMGNGTVVDEYTISIGSVATDEEQMEALDTKPAGYFTITGIRLNKEPESGMYIILYDNGMAKKMVR